MHILNFKTLVVLLLELVFSVDAKFDQTVTEKVVSMLVSMLAHALGAEFRLIMDLVSLIFQ